MATAITLKPQGTKRLRSRYPSKAVSLPMDVSRNLRFLSKSTGLPVSKVLQDLVGSALQRKIKEMKMKDRMKKSAKAALIDYEIMNDTGDIVEY
jgi:hypothetical protein